MRLLVCVKAVPDSAYYHKIRIDPVTKTLVREGIPTKMNEEDRYALEAALIIRDTLNDGSTVDVLSMAPPSARESLLMALAMGADRIFLLSDKKFAGSDTYATSYALSKAVLHIGMPDLILAGDSSEDGGTCHVPAQLGQWLSIAHIQRISDIKVEVPKMIVKKKLEGMSITYGIPLPAVIAVTRDLKKPRIPTMRGILQANRKPFIVLSADDVGCKTERVGLAGSPTSAGKLLELDTERKGMILQGTPEEKVDQLIAIIKRTVGLQQNVRVVE